MKKKVLLLVGIVVVAISATTGYAAAQEVYKLPDMLSNAGMTAQECYISIDEEDISRADSEKSEAVSITDPLDNLRLTSCFGYRWGRQHQGIDLGMSEGAPIYAAWKGTVTFAGYYGGYGNLVMIQHGEEIETYYAHCSRLLVKEGQQIEAGDVIAEVGSTGNSTGPHLHFEVRINGVPQDPKRWLEL